MPGMPLHRSKNKPVRPLGGNSHATTLKYFLIRKREEYNPGRAGILLNKEIARNRQIGSFG
jgi:hypothetical protein